MFLNSKFLLLFCIVVLAACTSAPPANKDNICSIFQQKSKWYRAAKKSSKHWGAPIHLPMAIMYQESSFDGKAKPPMQYFLGVIPTGRKSNAYGYSQALESTWSTYQREIGSRFKDRDDFADSYDFIQWYISKTNKVNGVSKWDAYAQYLNYHEGQGGYARGTYKNKSWLINVAKRVDNRAKKYAAQLSQCKKKL